MNTTLHDDNGRPTLRFERRLDHPREKVWRAITDPAEMAGWTPWTVTVQPRVGGRMTFVDANFGPLPDGTVTEIDPPTVFAYTWGEHGEQLLRWELRDDGDGCLLIFTHAFDDRPTAARNAAGWDLCLKAMDATLSGTTYAGEPGEWVALNADYTDEFGLLDGEMSTVDGGWRLRFEQDLMSPIDAVWAAINDSAGDAAGSPAVERDAPNLLVYQHDRHELVRWELARTEPSTRLTLTVDAPTKPTEARRAHWRAELAKLGRRPPTT